MEGVTHIFPDSAQMMGLQPCPLCGCRVALLEATERGFWKRLGRHYRPNRTIKHDILLTTCILEGLEIVEDLPLCKAIEEWNGLRDMREMNQ